MLTSVDGKSFPVTIKGEDIIVGILDALGMVDLLHLPQSAGEAQNQILQLTELSPKFKCLDM